MNDKGVDRIVCATDSGREGELIFRYIYHQAGCKKPVDRLWISSMTDAAIREGFAHFLGGFTVKEVRMSEIGQEAIDDARVAWGTYAIRVVDKASGAESTQTGRFTDVQKKIDGRWLYVVDHPSDDPPAKPATAAAAASTP